MEMSPLRRPLSSLTAADAMAIEQLNANISPLLKIPPEVREMIFEYAVIFSAAIDIIQGTKLLCQTLKQPPLAETSRQLRREILPIFYSENTFQITCSIKETARKKLRSIVDREQPGWLWRNRTSDEQLVTFMNHSYAIMEKFAATRHWLKTIGVKNQHHLRSISISCEQEDAPVIREMSMLRWDAKYLSLEDALIATDALPLVEGWEWEDATAAATPGTRIVLGG